MISTQRIITTDTYEWLTRYQDLGGIMDFKIMEITGASSEIEAHFEAAKATLEFIKHDIDDHYEKLAASLDIDRNTHFAISISNLSIAAGKPIAAVNFFGPFFNLEQQRPILMCSKGTPIGDMVAFDRYHYYDDVDEKPEDAVHVQLKPIREYVTQGYTDAFFSPPHLFGSKLTNPELGQFFLYFSRFMFGDLDKIQVYAWPTDCSNYFDDGLEWWGSFFWTVYNAEKKWFIGICASATD